MIAIAIHPIKTARDCAAAIRRAWDLREAAEGSPEADEAAILLDLIEAYEARSCPLPTVTGRALLAQCLVDHDLSQSQVPEVGPQPIVSAVLAGRRAINPRMAIALSHRFKMSPDAFLT